MFDNNGVVLYMELASDCLKCGFWDSVGRKPTRDLIISMDTAPYHHGVQEQLSSRSKELGLELHISVIRFIVPNGIAGQAGTEMSFNVPPAGTK